MFNIKKQIANNDYNMWKKDHYEMEKNVTKMKAGRIFRYESLERISKIPNINSRIQLR